LQERTSLPTVQKVGIALRTFLRIWVETRLVPRSISSVPHI
jgi:hypothetical protein